MDIRVPIGDVVEAFVEFLLNNFGALFGYINFLIDNGVTPIENFLLWLPFYVVLILLSLIAWKIAGVSVAVFTFIGLFLVENMGLWEPAISTLSLVIMAELVTLILGLPLGILMAKNLLLEQIMRPVLDFMQTMPAFVYLIPAVMFFSLGTVPGVIATIVFSMPPMIRLTALGIQQVPEDLVEAGRAFGCTPSQLLIKVELPHALATIMAGVNQSIMLALSMVVIAAMIGAGGLGAQVLRGIQRVDIGMGFESGLAVVILAIFLDRITQTVGSKRD